MRERVVPRKEEDEDVCKTESLSQLRDLLIGPEQRQLDAIQKRLDDPDRWISHVSDALPEAIARRSQDPELQAALMPAVEAAVDTSVRRDPHVLVKAIFPLMGPAIRRSIASMFEGMVQSLNESLERSLSLEGLRWRLEAFQTGKSLAEVALLHTLEYRVEQVLLIDERSGLLVQHVVDPSAPSQDVDLISGMLSAIKSFVEDSFRIERSASLETMKVGDLTVLIEAGPLALLVAVVRGTIPAHLRSELQSVIEHLHREHGRLLEGFSGDNRLFEILRPQLESCLQKRFRPKKSQSRLLVWVTVGLFTILLVVAARAFVGNWRWSRYVEKLKAEQGLIVLDARNDWLHYTLTGLRDPMAADPASILKASGLNPSDVASNWITYSSAVPDFVVARSRELLGAPDTVQLIFHDGILKAAGRAEPGWSEEARHIALLVPAVTKYDDSQLNLAWKELFSRARPIEEMNFHFDWGSPVLRHDQAPSVFAAAAALENLLAFAQEQQISMKIEIIGHTDDSGGERQNERLGDRRAATVAQVLRSRKIDHQLLRMRSAGNREPFSSTPPVNDSLNRRVNLRIHVAGAATP